MQTSVLSGEKDVSVDELHEWKESAEMFAFLECVYY